MKVFCSVITGGLLRFAIHVDDKLIHEHGSVAAMCKSDYGKP